MNTASSSRIIHKILKVWLRILKTGVSVEGLPEYPVAPPTLGQLCDIYHNRICPLLSTQSCLVNVPSFCSLGTLPCQELRHTRRGASLRRHWSAHTLAQESPCCWLLKSLALPTNGFIVGSRKHSLEIQAWRRLNGNSTVLVSSLVSGREICRLLSSSTPLEFQPLNLHQTVGSPSHFLQVCGKTVMFKLIGHTDDIYTYICLCTHTHIHTQKEATFILQNDVEGPGKKTSLAPCPTSHYLGIRATPCTTPGSTITIRVQGFSNSNMFTNHLEILIVIKSWLWVSRSGVEPASLQFQQAPRWC